MLSLTVAMLLLCQDPAPAPAPAEQGKQEQSSQASEARKVETWDDKVARAKIKAFEKAVKPKKVSMKERKDALDSLAGGSNERLVKPLAKFIEKDESVTLRRQAVEMLGDQPDKEARSAILKLLKNPRVVGNPQVQAGLIASLSRSGYESGDWSEIEDVLESDYDTERVPAHEALLELVAAHKEKQAIPMLLRNIDEPSPENVDAANNPPASYWKARWHSWAAWRNKVKDALFAITGQRFTTRKEAEQWLKENGRDLK